MHQFVYCRPMGHDGAGAGAGAGDAVQRCPRARLVLRLRTIMQ